MSDSCVNPNDIISFLVGTRGGVGWMRGPCACPRWKATRVPYLTEPRRILLQQGQAQGPLPAPHPPLVPTDLENCPL